MTRFGGQFGAAGILAGRFGGRRKASQYTFSARFGVKFGAHGRFGEQSGVAGISGVQPGAAEIPAELALTENGVYENGDNFCVRTPILANLGFLKS